MRASRGRSRLSIGPAIAMLLAGVLPGQVSADVVQPPIVGPVWLAPTSPTPGTIVTVNAHAADSLAVTSADFQVDGGPWTPMTAATGAFGDPSLDVTGSFVATGGAAQALAAGNFHSCAALTDGSVRCWGINANGELGNGTTTSSLTPIVVSGLSGVTAISAGLFHTCAVLADTTVQCWGFGSQYLDDPNGVLTPTVVPGLSGVRSLAAGRYHTCALMIDTTVRCWGIANQLGELGDGTTLPKSTVVQVVGLSGVTDLVAGDRYTCALVNDGTVRCWGGFNPAPLVVYPSGPFSALPVSTAGITTATAIGGGRYHRCAVLADTTVRCWGGGGALGGGTVSGNLTTVLGLSGAVSLGASGGASCATLTNGTVRCWGYPTGDGSGVYSATPVAVSGVIGASRPVGGGGHICAVVAPGGVKCWGDNDQGQLGDGTADVHHSPVSVVGITGVLTGTTQAICVRATDIDGNMSDGTACVSTDAARTLISIAVTPSAPTIKVEDDQPFTATGTYSDASTADLTATVTWSSSATGVATITASGGAHGVSPGTTTIGAAVGVVSGSTLLTVETESGAPTIGGVPTSPAYIGGSYHFAFTVTGSPDPTVTLDSGALPPGLSISSAGVLSGTTTSAGNYTFTLRAANGVLPDAVTPQLTLVVDQAIGRVVAVTGSVSIIHADLTRSSAVVGSPILAGDAIETASNGGIQILFVDNTTFSVSESARMTIDQYIFNTTEHSGTTFFSILQGLFVYTSGLIGHNDPSDVHIDTPVGGIGIRGTEFIATVDPVRDRLQLDLIHGELGITPRLTTATTIIDAAITAIFGPSGLIGTFPLTQDRYDVLKAQVSSPLKPALTATKRNNVGGSAPLGESWTWTIHVANSGGASAFFGLGASPVLVDELPATGISYGVPTVSVLGGVTGTLACAIDGTKTLACTAVGLVEVQPAGAFDVAVVATPSVTGTFANPRSGGACAADPHRANAERLDLDIRCSNTVNVIPAVRTIGMDIKPATSPNPFACGTRGTLPVAILSSATFDARTINASTVRLAGSVQPLPSPKSSIQDVNKDGRPDLLLHFDSPSVAAAIGCPRAVNTPVVVQLTATTLGGTALVASDVVRIVKG